MISTGEPIVEFRNITKAFPGVLALDDVSFAIQKGEVHALVGENGAGKSTLIKILSGVEQKDTGQIYCNGAEVSIPSPTSAFALGITSIYQELPLAPSLSVSDNVFLGQEIRKRGFLRRSEQRRAVREFFKEFDIDVDPGVPVERLSVSMQQITAIIKAMMKEARLFIMDEPTATLGEHEVGRLFDFIGKLKKKNISVLYISHRMDEIFGIADRVTVLKDGRYMGTRDVAQISRAELIALMSGKKIEEMVSAHAGKRPTAGSPVLEVRNLSYNDRLSGISFTLRKGEILGITGLVGAGKTELLKCIYGLYDPTGGEVVVPERSGDRPARCPTDRIGRVRLRAGSGRPEAGGTVPGVGRTQEHHDIQPWLPDPDFLHPEAERDRPGRAEPPGVGHQGQQPCPAGAVLERRQSAEGDSVAVAQLPQEDPADG